MVYHRWTNSTVRLPLSSRFCWVPEVQAHGPRRRMLKDLAHLKQLECDQYADPEMATCITGYELAHRMQTSSSGQIEKGIWPEPNFLPNCVNMTYNALWRQTTCLKDLRPYISCRSLLRRSLSLPRTLQDYPAPSTAQNEDWLPLFNGKDLSGWHVVLTPDKKGIDPAKVFQVHDGVIHVYQEVPQGVAVPVGYIASDDSYSWFHLKLEYRWGGKRFAPRVHRPRDAGALYHATSEEKVWPRCIECQIQEGDVGDCYTVNGVQIESTFDPKLLKKDLHQYLPASEGGVMEIWGGPKIVRTVKSSTHENDGWNTVEVIVRGDEEAIHIVNGHEVFHAKKLQQLDADQTSWSPLTSGHILLQGEFSEVLYRNVQIMPLEGGPFRVADQAKPTEAKRNDYHESVCTTTPA